MRGRGFVVGLFMISVIGLAAWFGPAKILGLANEFDQTKGPLALLAVVATIIAGVWPILSHLRRPDAGSAGKSQVPVLQPGEAHQDAAIQSVEPSQLLPAAESITAYLDQLEASLKESAAREHFVLLKAEEGVAPRQFPFLIQKVEQRDALGTRSIDLLKAHKDLDRYVLLGPPGSGKSTCLERLVLDLIDAYRKDPEQEYIPVFCSLARWTNKRVSALDLLKQSVAQLTGPRNRLAGELEEYLAQGKLVVILDGLNEMPNRVGSGRRGEHAADVSSEQRIAGNVASGQLLGIRVDSREESVRELASSRGVRSRFVLSCRTHEFAGSLNWKRVHLLPMETDQIQEFLKKYVPEDHESLSKILSNNRALFELAHNPFYLRLLTVVFDQDLTKVENLVSFYRCFLRHCWNERELGGAMI
jgi:hypothetical protein